MIAATMFSGIGAPEVAMPGWQWLWHAEIDRFANAVMAKRHPRSLNIGDVSGSAFVERAERAGRPACLVFGSPCQSFSVAGRRLGLDDPRGNLALVALGIVARLKPDWFVFENVPGLLSSAAGRDFGLFLRAVDELGYSGAWSVLDAQYTGLAQRRERVFFVGHAGNWRGPAAVLLEPESLCGDSPPRRASGQRIAPTLEARADGGGAGWGTDFLADGGMTVAPDIAEVAWALQERDHKGVDSDTKDGHLIVVADPISTSEGRTYTHEGRNNFRLRNVVPVLEAGARTGREGHEAKDGLGIGEPGDPMFSLQSKHQHAVAFKPSHYTRDKDGAPAETVPPLTKETDKGDQDPLLLAGSAVRRLMPRECERLQGFPDDYTLVTYRGKPAADGPRFKALGNSMAVPVVRWILSRIEMFDVKQLSTFEPLGGRYGAPTDA
jgi:DNA (cytosine-5)-methyltransferase 1